MDRCDTCGQTLRDGRDILVLDESEAVEKPAPPAAPGIGKSILIGASVFGALWVLASILTGGSTTETAIVEPADEIALVEQETNSESTPTPTDSTPAESSAESTATPDSFATVATPADTMPSDRPVGNSVDAGVLMLRRHLETTGAAATIAYPTADGVSVIDLRTGEIRELEVSETGPTIFTASSHLLRLRDRALLVDPTVGAVRAAPVTDGIVVRNVRTAEVTLFEPAGGDFTVRAPTGAVAQHELPGGAEAVPFAGFGFVAIAADDSSHLVTIDGLEPISDHRVVAATQSAQLELRCENLIDCSLVVVTDAGEQTVPASFGNIGDSYLLSPDGSGILRWDPNGRAELHVPDARYSTIVGTGVEYPVWAPDSSFIVWLDVETESPQLKAVLQERREWLTWDIATMDAPDPTGAELIIW